jgi:hypothetical protein
MQKNPNRYFFSLSGINIDKVHEKYGLVPSAIETGYVPANATKIEELDIKKPLEIVSFLDESKRLRKCTVSTINFSEKNKHYKCYWDRNTIPDNIRPIGCPIRYIANRANKTYLSHISKEKYSIYEAVTEKRAEEIKRRKNDNLSLESKGFYETDGIFCSFNCCMAFIESQENKHDPQYKNSKQLLLSMYNDLHPNDPEISNIMPAPHWRNLTDFGGNLSIEKFRESFNRVLYTDHGVVLCRSIGKLYETQIKF